MGAINRRYKSSSIVDDSTIGKGKNQVKDSLNTLNVYELPELFFSDIDLSNIPTDLSGYVLTDFEITTLSQL